MQNSRPTLLPAPRVRAAGLPLPRMLAGLSALLLPLAACHRASAPATTTPAVSLAACAVPAARAAATSPSLAGTPVENPAMVFDTAWTIIARTHWDTTYNGVNWRALRDELRPRAAAAKTTGELRTVLSDMVGRLKQSHFSIIPREVSDVADGPSSPKADMSGTVGASIRYVDGRVLVTGVEAGSSAARAGVRTGWAVEAVDGCPLAPRLARIPTTLDARRVALTGFSLGTAALSGAVGDSVRVTFRDGANAERVVMLTREAAKGSVVKFGNLPPVNARLDFMRVPQGARTIGVIRFNIWMPVLAAQFDAAIDALRDTDAIVLDIRGNFGGVGGMSMGFAGHFIDERKSIGAMHQRSGTMQFVANPRRADTQSRPVTPFTGPVALVVDELSISTTEIFAAGMQALGRARVFGVQSAGQALPSVPERLPNGDILYHAIADFTSPTGKQIEGDGVTPNVVIPVTRKALLDGKDPALDAALAWAAKSAPAKRPITP